MDSNSVLVKTKLLRNNVIIIIVLRIYVPKKVKGRAELYRKIIQYLCKFIAMVKVI